jgi:hypothetical protein
LIRWRGHFKRFDDPARDRQSPDGARHHKQSHGLEAATAFFAKQRE